MSVGLKYTVALLTDRGGRSYNEDACGHWQSPSQLCCVLADGAGGHGGGDVASKLVVQELIGLFARQPSHDGAALAALMRRTNELLRAQREPGTERQDMHSTVVSLVLDLDNASAHWAHVGDSRLYWFSGGRIVRRTKDHSMVQALVDAGILTADQMSSHPKRSELRSAMGLPDDALELSSGDGDQAVQAHDVFLLCTDGIWEYLDDDLLERTLAEASTQQAWLETLGKEVRRLAQHKASHDNFTALTVWVGAT
ncbi:PP2C family protein-serine/threonine phosphatase [Roseateles oligotrophus]|uniref:Protein phosphatase 2C domain-containing protein n=1 Tax=Roseateles oligotrophus TaxID=1769250 RepID=A0ABT2YG51_9BURK|nr:protein phosphatase 2C domain-containing protein [Roseateles oligotrophus]MCV2369033.1 protein phosphatase 2C domain-containing protein [Roseateles oligotrophus]